MQNNHGKLLLQSKNHTMGCFWQNYFFPHEDAFDEIFKIKAKGSYENALKMSVLKIKLAR